MKRFFPGFYGWVWVAEIFSKRVKWLTAGELRPVLETADAFPEGEGSFPKPESRFLVKEWTFPDSEQRFPDEG